MNTGPIHTSTELRTAVIYARYSCSSQTEQSIEGQLHDAYDFASREGYTVIREYIDRNGRTSGISSSGNWTGSPGTATTAPCISISCPNSA